MRKNTRKLLSLTLALCLALVLLPTAALAEETQTSGTYGDVSWKFENGTLTISGPGGIDPNPTASMGYIPGDESYPWRSYCDETTAVVLADGITHVGSQAFRGFTNLASVTIPDSVTRIGFGAFAYCSSLTSVKIPNGVKEIAGCIRTISILPGAFTGCTSLTSVTLPDSLTAIGPEAFMGCKSLASISIPSGVTSIGGGAFAYCSSLTSVKIPDGVEVINGQYMYNSNEIIPGTFSGCTSLTSVTIPDSVTEIGSQAFSDCSSLTSVVIPDSITSIGNGAFAGCSSLTSVTLPKDLTEIGQVLLAGCSSLKSVTIPGNVTKIGHGAFSHCTSLTSVTIPDGVMEIEGASYGLWGSINSGTFEGCSSLTSVTIPSSVTSIGNGAFYQCNNLKDVYYCGTEEQWKSVSIVEEAMIAAFPYNNYPLLNATIHYNSTMPEQPQKPAAPATASANPTNDSLTINGAAATPAAYKINDENYFKLRDLAALLSGTESQFSVDWNDAAQSIAMTTGQPYEKLPTDLQGKPTVSSAANLSGDALYVNGTKTDLTVYKVNGNNYFRLRDLGTLLDFYVGYENGTIVIDTSMPYSK